MDLGVYVHIPYCVKKCPYCDFNSYGVGNRLSNNVLAHSSTRQNTLPLVGTEPPSEEKYTDALLKEFDFYKESMREFTISSIFFGGGTPSLFSTDSIGRIIERILDVFPAVEKPEISLEANPNSADVKKLKELRDAGVNRLSVGVQSFSGRKLKFLGRLNTPDDNEKVLRDITLAGFSNFNMDLIYGCSFETLPEWKEDLESAVQFGSTHISAYCLTVEEGTVFGKLHSQGKLPLPDEETLTDMMSFTTDFLEDAGYSQYEISNFAEPEFRCRHNLLYWKGQSYLGIGAGAHSYIAPENSINGSRWGTRRANIKSPSLYMKAVSDGKKPVHFEEHLGRAEALEDRLLMGLRLSEGIDLSEIGERFGVISKTGKLCSLHDSGFIEISGDRIKLTRKGILLSNEVIYRVLYSLETKKQYP